MSRDRDRILEQALKHELSAAGTPPAGACLDADTLGAWTDGGLDPAAMAAAEAHVSNCARCQALVGAMARATPVAEATEGRGFPLWKWWLAPIAAGIAATTLWMVVPEQPQPMMSVPESKIADSPQARVATEPPRAQAPRDEPQAFAQDKLAAATRDDRQQESKKEERNRENAPARQMQERTALADAAVPAAPPAPPAPRLPAAAAEAPAIAALQKSARSAAGIEIATLDPSLGWRIAGDRLERSEDGGKTWTVTRQDPTDGITAGSAPSNPVCWFVGRAGRVLLTINGGATFMDVSLAEPLDLASVAAIDARTAMIFSVVGRRFRTDDGGRTWRPY